MNVKMTNSEVAGVSVMALDGRIVMGEESRYLGEIEKPNRGGKKEDCPEYGQH